jgi:CBS domain-containing protein
MKTWLVRDVMTREVATVGVDTPYRDIVDILAGRRISAAPVVDTFGRVLGVVSEADLLHKVEKVDARSTKHLFEGRRRRRARVKADARCAGDLMTAPAVTTYADTSIAAAARLMEAEQVRRVPVVDDLGRLVGIVTRGDLLRVHLRPDEDIRRDIVEDVLGRILLADDGRVGVEVRDGIAQLTGRLDSRSSVAVALRLAQSVPGVVAVVDELSYDRDDSLVAELASPGHPMGHRLPL